MFCSILKVDLSHLVDIGKRLIFDLKNNQLHYYTLDGSIDEWVGDSDNTNKRFRIQNFNRSFQTHIIINGENEHAYRHVEFVDCNSKKLTTNKSFHRLLLRSCEIDVVNLNGSLSELNIIDTTITDLDINMSYINGVYFQRSNLNKVFFHYVGDVVFAQTNIGTVRGDYIETVQYQAKTSIKDCYYFSPDQLGTVYGNESAYVGHEHSKITRIIIAGFTVQFHLIGKKAVDYLVQEVI